MWLVTPDPNTDEQRYFLDVTGVDEEQMVYYARNDLDIKASLDCIYIETWTELPRDVVIEAYHNYEDPEDFVREFQRLDNMRDELSEEEYTDCLERLVSGESISEREAENETDSDSSSAPDSVENQTLSSGETEVVEEGVVVNAPFSLNTEANE